MSKQEQLKAFLENEILPDLEVAIDELFGAIESAKSATDEQKADLEEMREMRTECFAIIEEINRNELSDEEAAELLEELLDSKSED